MASTFDSNSVWLVTGCSTGLGQSIARYIYAAGHRIVATARKVDSLSYLPETSKVLKLSLDVTSRDSIKAAIDDTLKRFKRLDVVVNCAGYGVTTELESFPEEEARRQVETLFWGPVYMTRESIRVFREVNPPGQGGTIVQVTSIGGYLAAEGNAFYHAGKFALEGFTKSVQKELLPKWNIKLLILSPGGVKTNFAGSIKYLPRHPAYANEPEAPVANFIKYMEDPSLPATWADPYKCAAVVFDAVLGQKARPLPTRLNLGAETLPLMRGEVDLYLKEMKDWEEDTRKVMPSTSTDGKSPLVDRWGFGKA